MVKTKTKRKNKVNKDVKKINKNKKGSNSSNTSNKQQDTSKIVLSMGKRAPIDSIDVKLIEILLENGRLSNVEIANMLKTSEATIRRRIQTLIDRGFIRGFSALLDYKRFGQVIKAHIQFQVKKNDIENIANMLMEMENSCTVYRVMGEYNLTSMMVFNNISDLQEFIDHFSELDSIENMNYLLVTSAYKSCPLTGI